MKKSVLDFAEMKKKGQKISYLVCYDYPMACLAEKAGTDMILVGDSVAMVTYGHSGTEPATMEQMIAHCQAVRKGAPNTFIIGDMPFLSYELSVENAIYNAGRLHKEAGVDTIKLEGGRRITKQIEGIVDAGMSVMGHIGMTPQSSAQLGGFGVQGATAESAIEIIKDALAIEKSGAFAITLVAVPSEVGRIITEKCKIPILGLGAGPHVDGQISMSADMLGIFEAPTPEFIKKYANLSEIITKVFTDYIEEVANRSFPEKKHCYEMLEGESEKLKTLLRDSNI